MMNNKGQAVPLEAKHYIVIGACALIILLFGIAMNYKWIPTLF